MVLEVVCVDMVDFWEWDEDGDEEWEDGVVVVG